MARTRLVVFLINHVLLFRDLEGGYRLIFE